LFLGVKAPPPTWPPAGRSTSRCPLVSYRGSPSTWRATSGQAGTV